jgi:sortase B
MTGKRAVKIANNVFNKVILVAIFLLFLTGGYAMWDSAQIYREADAARYEKYKPDEDSGAALERLAAVNPDVRAWLTVYGTHIDYPVMQAPDDNTKYVNMDAEGNYSLSGAIFMDYRCSADFSDFSTVLYGHHMEKDAMFGEIESFADKEYFDERKYGEIYYGGKYHGIKIFAFLRANAYDFSVFRTGIARGSESDSYTDLLVAMSERVRGVRPEGDEGILLMSTCAPGPTGEREILVGVVTDEIYADPFADGGTGPVGRIADRLGGIWGSLPLWAKTALILLAALVIAAAARRAYAVKYILKKKDKKHSV